MRARATSREARPKLRRPGGRSGWSSLALRCLLALGLIGVAIVGHWIDRNGLRDNVDGEISFADVLYFTMITITSVGYGDIVPVTPRARMFDTVVVTPIRLFVWLIFIGAAYEFLLKQVWETWRMGRLQDRLHGHVIVAGFGASGAEAVNELIRRGVAPEQIVVIDPKPAALEAAGACGVAVLEGDATRNAVLESVQIARARCLAVAAGRDDTSILIVLTARGVAPHVPISVVVRADDNEDLARQAGATTVINPASFAGLLLASSAQGAHIAEYMADLAAVDGQVAMRERPVTDAVGASSCMRWPRSGNATTRASRKRPASARVPSGGTARWRIRRASVTAAGDQAFVEPQSLGVDRAAGSGDQSLHRARGTGGAREDRSGERIERQSFASGGKSTPATRGTASAGR